MKRLKQILISILRMAAVLYFLLLVILFFFQERLIFMPEKLSADYKYDFQAPFEEKSIPFENGSLNTLLFRIPQSKGVILYFHGNYGSLASWGEVAHELSARTGFSVWIIDYPGYGKSTGAIRSEGQLHAMALKFYKMATAEFPKTPLVVYGRSIGTGVATQLASQQPVQALILEAPYYSLKSVAGQNAPWAPLFILKYTFTNFEWIANIKAPVLILHGDHDEVIPYSQAQRLAAVSKDTLLVTIPDGRHNDLGDYDLYWKALLEFLSRPPTSGDSQ